MDAQNDPVPVTILTGFLGSGKTTLLNALLCAPQLADTAVIINEFGEIGLDHLLIEQAIEDAVLLKNGCICCTVRGDIADTLGELFRKREAGELPWFSRIAIETTGLANPAPVAHALGAACRLDGVVTTADALHLPAQLAEHDTARLQIAFADRIVLTKTDLATPAQRVAAEGVIRQLNPRADIVTQAAPDDVFGLELDIRRAEERSVIRHSGSTEQPLADDASLFRPTFGDISSVLLRAGEVDWDGVRAWLDSILSLRGADILRIKGVLRLRGHTPPMVLQAVHHVVSPLMKLPEAAWESVAEGSFLVVIGRALSERGLAASFAQLLPAPTDGPNTSA